jgi:hypothetical protein
MSKIAVIVSVDWEGRSLLGENLRAMAEFRRQHPDIPMQQFLNAAYYTRAGVSPAQTTAAIRQGLLPQDEIGLHIHAWHSLLTAAGVTPRDEPHLLDDSTQAVRAADDWEFYAPEGGYDVPLECFESTELERLIETSNAILIAQGFDRPVSFRAGAWMAGPKVHSALARQGFRIDCSQVDPQWVLRRFGDIPLYRWLCRLWPGAQESDQPYRISVPSGELWQVPNNAALVDYVPAEELVDIFQRAGERWQAMPCRSQFISSGFHQETARKFLWMLDRAVREMRCIARQRCLPLVFLARPWELFV